MDDNYDVVEMDFPPYEEEYSHLPEPESTVEPFYKVKEEVYRRNRAIAAEEQTALLKAEERRKAEKRERYREMLEEAKPVKRRGLIGKEKLIPWIIVVVGIVSSLHRVDNSKPDTDGVYVTSVQPEQVLQATTVERVTRAAEAEENAFDELKLGIVREPFENDGVSYVYCTSAMSYRFTPSYDEHDGEPCLHINVDVKNLTDYDYIIVPNFTIKKEFIYFPKVNGEYVYQPDGLLVYEFDKNSLCSFLLEFDYYNVEADGAVLDFSTQSFKTTDEAEKCDEDFEIPIKTIMAILETEAVTTEEKTAKATTVKSETDAYEEMLKTTLVREPFDNDGVSYIHCTDTMSYKFKVKYYDQEYKYRDDGKKVYNCVHLDVTVKNLTDYPYMVMSEFYFCTNYGEFKTKGLIDGYNQNNAFSSGGADSEPEAFSFDENNLCNFSIDFAYIDGYHVEFYYLPERVSDQFVQYAAEDFMIPIEDIMNFLT